MYDKLNEIEKRYEELQRKIENPAIVTDVSAYRDTMKSIAEIEEVVVKFRELRAIRKRIAEAREMLHADDEMRELAEMELSDLEPKEPALEAQLQVLLQPKDPNDDKNVFVEVRAGTGGDEAAIFAGDLFRMYSRYAESHGFAVEILSENPGEHGGYREIISRIAGRGAFSRLKASIALMRVTCCSFHGPRIASASGT